MEAERQSAHTVAESNDYLNGKADHNLTPRVFVTVVYLPPYTLLGAGDEPKTNVPITLAFNVSKSIFVGD